MGQPSQINSSQGRNQPSATPENLVKGTPGHWQRQSASVYGTNVIQLAQRVVESQGTQTPGEFSQPIVIISLEQRLNVSQDGMGPTARSRYNNFRKSTENVKIEENSLVDVVNAFRVKKEKLRRVHV